MRQEQWRVYKKRTPIRRVSSKKRKQLHEEFILKVELEVKQHGRCAKCGKKPDWRGLQKHEKVFRSQGGSPTDKDNVELICAKCHSGLHGIKEV